MPNTTIGVAEVVLKDVNTKYGLKPTCTIRGTDGKMYNFGFKNPRLSVGDTVNLTFTEGKYGNDVTSHALGGTPVATSPTPVAREEKKPYSPPAKVFPIPPLHGDRAIVRQNAITNAREVFVAAHGGKPFAVDFDSDSNVIIALARKFEAYACGDLDMLEAMKGSGE